MNRAQRIAAAYEEARSDLRASLKGAEKELANAIEDGDGEGICEWETQVADLTEQIDNLKAVDPDGDGTYFEPRERADWMSP